VVGDHDWLALIDSSKSVVLFPRPVNRDVRCRGSKLQLVQLEERGLRAVLSERPPLFLGPTERGDLVDLAARRTWLVIYGRCLVDVAREAKGVCSCSARARRLRLALEQRLDESRDGTALL
jgi:hypothetical protein